MANASGGGAPAPGWQDQVARRVAGSGVVTLLAIPPTFDPGGAEPEPGPRSRPSRYAVALRVLTGGQNPAPQACGSKADGMAPAASALASQAARWCQVDVDDETTTKRGRRANAQVATPGN